MKKLEAGVILQIAMGQAQFIKSYYLCNLFVSTAQNITIFLLVSQGIQVGKKYVTFPSSLIRSIDGTSCNWRRNMYQINMHDEWCAGRQDALHFDLQNISSFT